MDERIIDIQLIDELEFDFINIAKSLLGNYC